MAKAQYKKNSNQTSKNKITAFYLRVSKNDQITENQKLQLERVAQKSNWDIYKYYIDTGISGTKLGRPIIFEEKVQDVLSLRAGGMSMLKIAKKLNIGTGTVQKILKTYDISKDVVSYA